MTSNIYKNIVAPSSSAGRHRSKILCVGVCCLDIVQTCKEFPSEDSDQRSVEYRWQRGGNASNTCTVLAALGTKCEFLGVLSGEEHLNFLKDDMRKCKVEFSHCPTIEGIGCPTSTVILSLSTGSRTIVHHNPNLPELALKDFDALDLDEYMWIHFEGRNVSQVLLMMQRVENYNSSLRRNARNIDDFSREPITISVELERSKPGLMDLLPYADIIFISKDYAHYNGFSDAAESVMYFGKHAKPGASVICAWGERGATALTLDNTIVQSAAFPPSEIIDSLGAGDTFNAAVIYYLNKAMTNRTKDKQEATSISTICNRNLHEIKGDYLETSDRKLAKFIDRTVLEAAILFGCRIAGAKVGSKGYSGIEEAFKRILDI